MAKPIPIPADVKIRALRARKADAVDLMEPGTGTPWEDRGTLGVGKAFTKTCKLGLQNPLLLLNSIHRPETAGDAWAFALGCGVMWSLSCIVHGVLYFLFYFLKELSTRGVLESAHQVVNAQPVFLKAGLPALLMPVAVLLLLKLGSSMFHKLVAAEEMRDKAPPVLTFNVMAYCLAPSILAPIPFVGPPLALGAILSMMIRAAEGRLHIKRTGAIICSVLTFVSMLAIVVAAWLLALWISTWSFDKSVEEIPAPKVRVRSAQ